MTHTYMHTETLHTQEHIAHKHTHTHTQASSEPIYLVPSLGMSFHDDGSPFSLLGSIGRLGLLTSLINHALQVNVIRNMHTYTEHILYRILYTMAYCLCWVLPVWLW